MKVVHLLALAAVFGVATLFWLARHDVSERHAPSGGGSAAMRWHAGDHQVYALSVDSSAKVQMLNERVARPLRQRMSGSLHLHVVEVEEDRVHVGMRIAPLRMEIQRSARETEVQEAAGPPFLVTFSSSGRVLDFVFPDNAPPGLRDTLSELVRTFECVVPDAERESWAAKGRQSTGSFEAEYGRLADGNVVRRKTRYGTPEGTSITIEHSRDRYRLAWSSWLETASVHERLTVRSSDKAVVRHTNRGTLTRVEPSDGAHPELDLGRSLAAARADVRRFRVALKDQPTAPARPKPTVKEVQSAVRAVNASDGVDAKSLMLLAQKLAADPSMVDLVVEAIESDDVTDGTDSALLNALGTSGTPEAQRALAAILLDRERRHRNRLRATVALSLVARPTEEAMAGLWKAADERDAAASRDVSNTALLALGTTTGTLSRTGSPQARVHGGRLVARLKDRRDRRETPFLLKALGNTRDLAYADEIAVHLEAKDPGERKAAAYSLRTMGREETSDRLAARLQRETDGAVRQAIATSLSRLGGATANALAIVLAEIQKEPDEATRFAMAELLSRYVEAMPQTKSPLEKLLRKEQSKRIRKCLAEALYGRKRAQ